jgi:hypothetical protein
MRKWLRMQVFNEIPQIHHNFNWILPSNYASVEQKQIRILQYQAKADKPYRIIIRNLHLTTDINLIKTELTSKGFSVRNISNINLKQSKSPFPIFFNNLESALNNSNIFKMTSLCYIKIKIKEPHSWRDLPQCHRCQNYGHTKHNTIKTHAGTVVKNHQTSGLHS